MGQLMFVAFVLQKSQLEFPDISVQQSASDDDERVRVAAAAPSTERDVVGEAVETSSESVDDVNLSRQTVALADAPRDANAITLREIESEIGEKFDAADSEPVCDKTITVEEDADDDAPRQRLDETVTDLMDDKLESGDTVTVSNDDIVDAETVSAGLSENDSQLESRLACPADSDVAVLVAQSQPVSVTDNSACTDVHVNQQIVDADSVVSERRESHDAADNLHALSVTTEDTVNVELEKIAAATEDGALSSVEEDRPCHSSDTVAQLVDAGDAAADSGTEAVIDELEDIASRTTPEMVDAEAQKPASDLPECPSDNADEFVEALRGTGGGDRVPANGEVTRGSVDAETATQVEYVEDEREHSEVVELATGNDAANVESESQPSICVGTDAETHAQSEHADTDKSAQVSTSGDDVHVVESGHLPSISVDKSLNDSVAGQEETVAETGGATGDWLDKVVDVSNVSFVSGGDVTIEHCADFGKEPEMDKVAPVDVGNDDADCATATETVHDTVVATVADDAKTVETSVETVADVGAENSVTTVETVVSVDTNNVHPATARETPEIVVTVDADRVTEVETPPDTVAVVDSGTHQMNVDEASRQVTEDPAGKEDSSGQVTMDVTGSSEKSRLYSKNVAKSDASVVDPAASLATNVSSIGKAGTPAASEQDDKATGDQPSENRSVVMRKKSAQIDSAIDKENEPAKPHKVLTAFLLLLGLVPVINLTNYSNVFNCLLIS